MSSRHSWLVGGAKWTGLQLFVEWVKQLAMLHVHACCSRIACHRPRLFTVLQSDTRCSTTSSRAEAIALLYRSSHRVAQESAEGEARCHAVHSLDGYEKLLL